MPRDLTSDGRRFCVGGIPTSVVSAHRVLIEDHGMDYHVERVGLIGSIKAWPEADESGQRIPYGPGRTT